MVEVQLEGEEDRGPSALTLVAATSPYRGAVHDPARELAGLAATLVPPLMPGDLTGEVARWSAGPPAPPPPPAPRRPRRRHVVVAAAVAVGLAAAGLTHAVEAQQARERAAESAALPGVVTAFAEPLAAVWRASTALGATEAGDLVLRWQESADGLELQAIDVATGTERWTTRRGQGTGVDWCEGAAGPGDPGRAAGGNDDEAGSVVVCWRVSPVRGAEPDAGDATFEGALVALSAAHGTVVAEHPLTLPSSGYGVLDGDVVLANREADLLHVVRLDPVSGELVWERELRLTARQLDGSHSAWLTVDDGLVVVEGTTTLVLAADGELLGRWDTTDTDAGASPEAQAGAQVEVTPHGFGVWPQASADGPPGSWYTRNGTLVAHLDGLLAEPEVRDAALPHVLLTTSRTRSDLTAVHAGTGDRLWTVPLEGGDVLVRRDGAAVVADGRRVFAVDLRTGAELWSVPVPGVRPDLGSVSDGDRVLVLAQSGGDWRLDAVGLDGVPLWSTDVPASLAMPAAVPPGTPALWGIDRRVVTTNGQVLVGLG